MLRPSGGEKCRLVSRLPRRQTADARRRQVRRLQGGMYEARENVWKEVFLNPETRITTFSESRLGSRPGIPHNSSQFLGMIRIHPCCKSSAPAHCGNLGIDFMDASRPRVTFPGLQVSPSGEAKCLRVTNHETRNTAFFRITALMPCSPLFAIVRYCSAKNIVPASVRAPSGVLVGPHDWPACLTSPRGETCRLVPFATALVALRAAIAAANAK